MEGGREEGGKGERGGMMDSVQFVPYCSLYTNAVHTHMLEAGKHCSKGTPVIQQCGCERGRVILPS